MSELNVGDRAQSPGRLDVTVLAIDDGEAWVRSDNGLRYTARLKTLTKVEPKWEVGHSYTKHPSHTHPAVIEVHHVTEDGTAFVKYDHLMYGVRSPQARFMYTDVSADGAA